MMHRRERSDPAVMADVLEGSSSGRVPSTWGVIESSSVPVLFAHGAGDTKFAAIAKQVAARAATPTAGAIHTPGSTGAGSAAGARRVQVSSIEGAAHAVLEEAPEACAKAVASFLQSVLSSDSSVARSAAYKCADREPLMIAAAGVRTLKLRLKEPLQLSSGDALMMREGCLIEIGTMSGHVGIGECTPLPAFHKESLEEARSQLLVVADLLHGRIIQPDLPLLTEGALAKWLVSPQSAVESFTSWHFQGPSVPTKSNGGPGLDAASLLPSVLCAVEMALLQIVAQSMEVPLPVAAAALCHGSMPKEDGVSAKISANRSLVYSHVYLNALLTRAETLPRTEGKPRGPRLEPGAGEARAHDGCSVVKVKVGGDSPVAQQAARVRAIADQASVQHQRLRLDANQCWTLPQAVQFTEALGSEALSLIDYIEEPLQDASLLPAFYEQTGMHYALDETLATLDSGAACSGNAAFETAIKGPGMAALVLKPTLLGGFARCLSLHRRAPPGTEAVVSAAFESGLLISHMAIMTASIFTASGGSTPHGLSTFERLEQDVLMPPLARQVHHGKLSLVRCERALGNLMRTLDTNEVISKPHGREEVPAIQGQGAPADAEEDEKAAMMRRFGAV